jgi:ethanolamine utilization protein EutN
MHPARIMGRVVATKKEPSLEGVKLLLLRPTDWDGNPQDDYLVAADAVGAGDSEFVFYVESREAAVVFNAVPPIDASVCGIIDGVFLDRNLYTPTK